MSDETVNNARAEDQIWFGSIDARIVMSDLSVYVLGTAALGLDVTSKVI